MDQDGPITVVVRHRVKPGRQPEFEDWLRGITGAALQFEGHSGFNVIQPSEPRQLEYLVFFRFDTFSNLQKWEESQIRREWLDRVEPLTVHPPAWERHTGL